MNKKMLTGSHSLNRKKFYCYSVALGTTIFTIAGSYSAYADPIISSISGSISQGQSVTITGSGFGSKTPAAPILWAPFDGNLNPSKLGRATSWQYNECVEYTTNGYSGGGAKTVDSCSKTGTAELGINTDTLGLGYYINTLGQKSYIFRNRKMNYTGDVNLKSMEFIGTDYTTNNNWVFNHSSNQWISQQVSPSSYFYMDSSPVENQWGTEELVVQANSTAGANANVKWYANGKLLGDSQTSGWFISARGSGGTNMMRIVPVFHGDYNISGGGTMSTTPEYWDSVYVDNTWSRVIIGNSSTYSSSTKREIQIPVNWSSDGKSIAISFNTGAFQNGEKAYLYVIDSNNLVNSTGYPITIGTGSATPTPAPAPVLNTIQVK